MSRYTRRLQVMLTAEQYEALEWFAARTESSVAEVARYFLPEAVPRRDALALVHEEGTLEAIGAAVDEERHAKYPAAEAR